MTSGLSNFWVLDFATHTTFFSTRVYPCACTEQVKAHHGAIWIQASLPLVTWRWCFSHLKCTFGAKLRSTYNELRHNNNNDNKNSTLCIVPVVNKRFKTLSTSWDNAGGRTELAERGIIIQCPLLPSTFLSHAFCQLPLVRPNLSLLLGQPFKPQKFSVCGVCCFIFSFTNGKRYGEFIHLRCPRAASHPHAAEARALDSCIASVLQSHRNREVGRAHSMQVSYCSLLAACGEVGDKVLYCLWNTTKQAGLSIWFTTHGLTIPCTNLCCHKTSSTRFAEVKNSHFLISVFISSENKTRATNSSA